MRIHVCGLCLNVDTCVCVCVCVYVCVIYMPLSGYNISSDRMENHLVCMDMLLRKGGNPNAVTNSLASVLHYLVRCAYSEKLMDLLQLLVDKGGNIDPREEYGETPLHQACFRGASQTVQFLIKHGAGLDNLNAYVPSPLKCCVTCLSFCVFL
jgi:Ankyrin repeats (3 copies)